MQSYLEQVGSELAAQAGALPLLELGRQMGVIGGVEVRIMHDELVVLSYPGRPHLRLRGFGAHPA